MQEQLTSSRFDLNATVDAIGLLKAQQMLIGSGPHTPWAMLDHAIDRFERELRNYLVPPQPSIERRPLEWMR